MYADPNQLVRDIKPFAMPPERVNTQYAAEKYMMLKGGGGMTPWKSKKTPYMVEPMNCLTQRIYHSVCFKGPARTGKTEALLKAQVAHAVKCDPSDIMIVHMNQNESEYFSKTEISPMLRATKGLKSCLSPIQSDNNVGMIRLKAGNVIKMAWPTDATFRGKSFKYILLPDYDAIKPPSEGDVYTLSRMRTKSYQSSGMVLAESSPGHESTNRNWKPSHPHECPPAKGIADLYMQGDRRRFYWQCPDCGESFIPTFETLIFDRNERDPVKASQELYVGCIHCGAVINEHQKNSLNNNGTWLKQGQTIDQNSVIHGEGLKSNNASFWLSGLPAGFSKWGDDFVQKWVKARNTLEITGDDRGMQAFRNTDCGEVYIPEVETEIDSDSIKANRHILELGVTPKWAKFLLASVDVQGGSNRRFEVQIHAIGDGKRQAVIDRFKITHFGERDIKPNLHAEHWNVLIDRVLDRDFSREDGAIMRPIIMAYDTNGEAGVYDRSQEFYRNNKAKYGARLFPVKGASHAMELLVEARKPDSKKDSFKKIGKKIKGASKQTPLYFINTDKIKDIITANIQLDAGLPKSIMYSKDLDDSFYSELTAESRGENGKWEKTGGNNEALDLCVYIWAILVYKGWVNRDKFDDPLFKSFTKSANIQKADKAKSAELVSKPEKPVKKVGFGAVKSPAERARQRALDKAKRG